LFAQKGVVSVVVDCQRGPGKTPAKQVERAAECEHMNRTLKKFRAGGTAEKAEMGATARHWRERGDRSRGLDS
jgi:hypothetical protein